jgi:hypothetical protein
LNGDFSGSSLQAALKGKVAFEGASGRVEFQNNGDRTTGVR